MTGIGTPKMFVNLPVRDVAKSAAFFRALGFEFNKQFTTDEATCMLVNGDGYVMLLEDKHFAKFTPKRIVDATQVEVLVALFLDSREQVDETVDAALAAGATPAGEPQDHGFMYVRQFDDLDGHTWEIGWMDPTFVQPQN